MNFESDDIFEQFLNSSVQLFSDTGTFFPHALVCKLYFHFALLELYYTSLQPFSHPAQLFLQLLDCACLLRVARRTVLFESVILATGLVDTIVQIVDLGVLLV